MYIKPLEKIADFVQFERELYNIIKIAGFQKNQIICQTIVAGSTDWHTGIGRIDELEDIDEELYANINPALEGTILADIIKKYQGFRTRIMLMSPRSCYSIHSDPTPRLHIPFQTNKSAWMAWPHNSTTIHLPLGYVYWTDTRKPHTFFNAGIADRIHIIMGVKQ
jgi:hypothetical protein